MWSGNYVALFSDIMKEFSSEDVIKTIMHRQPFLNRIQKAAKKKDFEGKYAKIPVQTDWTYNAGPREEATDVVLPGRDGYGYYLVYLSQMMSSMGFTQEEMEDLVDRGTDTLVDVVGRRRKDTMVGFKVIQDAYLQGDGTGRLARVSAWNAGTGTVTVDNTQANFGYDGVQLIKQGMVVDIFTVGNVGAGFPAASTWTPKALQVKVTSVNPVTNTFTIAAQTNNTGSVIGTDANVPADNDFVLIRNSVKCTTAHAIGVAGTFEKWLGPMGIKGIVDDGACAGNEFNDGSTNDYNGSWYGKTFQSVDRSLAANSFFRSRISRASDWAGGTDGTKTTCDLSVVNDEIRRILENDTGGDVTCIQMNGKTFDWFARLAFAESNAMVEVKNGKLIPGIDLQGYRYRDKIIPIIPITSLADGEINLANEGDLRWFEKVALGWYSGMGDETFPSPGTRNLTFERWLRTRMQIAALRCDNCTRIEDIDITS